MKKLLSIISAACIALSLTGCAEEIPIEDCVNANIGTSNYNQIMQTENGYYYNATMFGKMSLRYHDNETGNDIYLCAKPECTHDGDKFCTATSKGFTVCYTAMYGDNIYIAVTESDGEQLYYKLLRASLDGTELTELCTFMQLNNTEESGVMLFDDTRAMLTHRGFAFVPYYISTTQDKTLSGREGVALIDLSNGSYKLLPEYDMSTTNPYRDVTAYGDYFYYTMFSNGMMAQNEIHRYNYKTGEDETLTLRESMKDTYGRNFLSGIQNYVVVDGKIWYIWSDWSCTEHHMYIYDPEENTTTLVEQFEDKLYNFGEVYDDNGVLQFTTMDGYAEPELMYDGQYFYIAEHGFYGHNYSSWDMMLHIFTTDGENVGNLVCERSGPCQLNVLDGIVYLQTEQGAKYLAVSDIIAGNDTWTDLYEFENGQIIEY